MTNTSNIERAVMRRIYFIRALKPLFSSGVLSTLILITALWGIGREVFVAQVLHNAPAHPAALLNFYIAAFENTRLTVQGLMLLTLVSVIYLARETARALSSLLTPARV